MPVPWVVIPLSHGWGVGPGHGLGCSFSSPLAASLDSQAGLWVLSHSHFSPSFPSFTSFHPYDFTTLFFFLYPPNKPFHSFSFISPFHMSQEQDEMAHGLHSTIQ